MAEPLDPKEVASLNELVRVLTYTQDAIVNLLEQKGIMSKEEILEEIAAIRKEMGQDRMDA